MEGNGRVYVRARERTDEAPQKEGTTKADNRSTALEKEKGGGRSIKTQKIVS